MKPLVIIPRAIFTGDDNTECITLSNEDFEKYIQKAYDGGFADGQNTPKVWTTTRDIDSSKCSVSATNMENNKLLY